MYLTLKPRVRLFGAWTTALSVVRYHTRPPRLRSLGVTNMYRDSQTAGTFWASFASAGAIFLAQPHCNATEN